MAYTNKSSKEEQKPFHNNLKHSTKMQILKPKSLMSQQYTTKGNPFEGFVDPQRGNTKRNKSFEQCPIILANQI